MGIIKRGILGGYSNKVGNVVGSSWKGIATMRVLPLSVANPRTAAQVGNRESFRAVTGFTSLILTSIVKPLNDRFALRMSGFNLFVQRNKDVFSDPALPDWSLLQLSRGRLSQTEITATSTGSPNRVLISWNPSPSGSMDMSTDKVFVLCVSLSGEVVGTSSGVVSRSDGNVEIHTIGVEEARYVYVSFLRADGTEVSTSAYQEL